ncbi:hypothetical protein M8C21_007832, partial [Ambrosia artemisiifolia]
VALRTKEAKMPKGLDDVERLHMDVLCQTTVIKYTSRYEDLTSLLFVIKASYLCPTSSISTEKPARDNLEVQKTFPIPIDMDRIP